MAIFNSYVKLPEGTHVWRWSSILGECQDAIPCSAEVAGALCDLVVMEDGHGPPVGRGPMAAPRASRVEAMLLGLGWIAPELAKAALLLTLLATWALHGWLPEVTHT
jgi:hypothetical protein